MIEFNKLRVNDALWIMIKIRLISENDTPVKLVVELYRHNYSKINYYYSLKKKKQKRRRRRKFNDQSVEVLKRQSLGHKKTCLVPSHHVFLRDGIMLPINLAAFQHIKYATN